MKVAKKKKLDDDHLINCLKRLAERDTKFDSEFTPQDHACWHAALRIEELKSQVSSLEIMRDGLEYEMDNLRDTWR